MKLKVGFTEHSCQRALFDLNNSSMSVIYKICKYASDIGVKINYEGATYLGWEFINREQYNELDRIFNKEVMSDLEHKYSKENHTRLSGRFNINDVALFTELEAQAPENKLILINNDGSKRRLFDNTTSNELKCRIEEYANSIGVNTDDEDAWLFKNEQQYLDLVEKFNTDVSAEYYAHYGHLMNKLSKNSKGWIMLDNFKTKPIDVTEIIKHPKALWLRNRITFKINQHG